MVNMAGLRRDTVIACEHFRDYGKAKEYLIKEFGKEYDEATIVDMLDDTYEKERTI